MSGQGSNGGGVAGSMQEWARAGYLKMKKKKGLLSKWHKRYCTVDEGRFMYFDAFFERSDSNEPRGEIMLEEGERVEIEPTGVMQFTIRTLDNQQYLFEAETDTDQAYWLAALHESVLPPDELTQRYGADYATKGSKQARKEKKERSKAALERHRAGADKPKVMTLTVPKGKKGGETMKIQRGDKTLMLTIPMGLYEGNEFDVILEVKKVANKDRGDDNTIQHAGWLYKHAQKGRGNPQKRWFVLTKKWLSYSDEPDMIYKKRWSMENAKITESDREFGIMLKTYTEDDDVEELEVNCITEENMASWLSRLQLCINSASGAKIHHLDDASEGAATKSFVGYIVEGKPVFSGWLRKYADDGFLAERYKPKWFILTNYFLAYMDWEGAPVKRQWGLTKAKFKRIPCEHCIRFQFKVSNGGILDLACYDGKDAQHWESNITRLIQERIDDPLGKPGDAGSAPAASEQDAEADTQEASEASAEESQDPAEGEAEAEADGQSPVEEGDTAPDLPQPATQGQEEPGPPALANADAATQAEIKARQARREARRAQRAGAASSAAAPEPEPEPEAVAKADAPASAPAPAPNDKSLKGWLDTNGFGQYLDLIQSIGVADVEDLELVTKEDLIDLGFDDTDAGNMMNAIALIQ